MRTIRAVTLTACAILTLVLSALGAAFIAEKVIARQTTTVVVTHNEELSVTCFSSSAGLSCAPDWILRGSG